MIWTSEFWKGSGERGVKTFAQVFVAVATLGVGADAVGASAGLADVGWIDALSVAAAATVLSVATSIGNASFTAGEAKREPTHRADDKPRVEAGSDAGLD